MVAAARLKVLASLPSDLRTRAARLVERFHLDASAWFHDADHVPHLAALAESVWEGRRCAIRYRRGADAVERLVDPLGLVLKAGVWYVVAAVDGKPRTYRAARVLAVRRTDEAVARLADFDLATYWAQSTRAYEQDAPRIAVTVRVSPDAYGALVDCVGERAVRGATRLDTADPDGWDRLSVAVDWPEEVPGRLLGAGGGIEVLGPPHVRRRMRELAEEAALRYAGS